MTPGHVNIIVDDGSGAPPAAILAAVAAAVDLVRPIGTLISVNPPTLLVAEISLTVSVGASAAASTVQAEVQTALIVYINLLGVGQALRFSRLAGLCYDANLAVTNVQNVLLNSAMADIGGQGGTVVRAGAISVRMVAA